jgi:hypothetical protein
MAVTVTWGLGYHDVAHLRAAVDKKMTLMRNDKKPRQVGGKCVNTRTSRGAIRWND